MVKGILFIHLFQTFVDDVYLFQKQIYLESGYLLYFTTGITTRRYCNLCENAQGQNRNKPINASPNPTDPKKLHRMKYFFYNFFSLSILMSLHSIFIRISSFVFLDFSLGSPR